MSKKSGCAGCSQLKAVPAPAPATEARNFWNSCPRQLDNLPETPCSMGKPEKNRRGRIIQEPACPWWVNSEKDNFCFWKYVRNNSDSEGKMDALLQNEIAQLFGCSSTKIHFIVKDGVQKLKDGDDLGILSELSSDAVGTEKEPDLPSLERLGFSDVSDSEEPEES